MADPAAVDRVLAELERAGVKKPGLTFGLGMRGAVSRALDVGMTGPQIVAAAASPAAGNTYARQTQYLVNLVNARYLAGRQAAAGVQAAERSMAGGVLAGFERAAPSVGGTLGPPAPAEPEAEKKGGLAELLATGGWAEYATGKYVNELGEKLDLTEPEAKEREF